MNHGFALEKKNKERNQFFGKYRAYVVNNDDPDKMMRVTVKCPKVLGDSESNWAMPCLPVSYGFLPAVGSLVWVEFEEGDSNKPIWSGMWLKKEDAPAIIYENEDTSRFIIYTNNGKIVIDDEKETVTIECTGKVILNGQAIEVNGDMTINGALNVTGDGTIGGSASVGGDTSVGGSISIGGGGTLGGSPIATK